MYKYINRPEHELMKDFVTLWSMLRWLLNDTVKEVADTSLYFETIFLSPWV